MQNPERIFCLWDPVMGTLNFGVSEVRIFCHQMILIGIEYSQQRLLVCGHMSLLLSVCNTTLIRQTKPKLNESIHDTVCLLSCR